MPLVALCWVTQLRKSLWQIQLARPGKEAVQRMFEVIQEGEHGGRDGANLLGGRVGRVVHTLSGRVRSKRVRVVHTLDTYT